MKGSILIVEDEATLRGSLRRLLERRGYRVEEAGSVEEALEAHPPDAFDLVIADLRLPGAPGVDLIAHAQEVPVLIVTGHASVASAVEAMRRGAADYLVKPFDYEELFVQADRLVKLRRSRRRSQALESDMERLYPVQALVGESPPMQRVHALIEQVAPTDSSVLITGESGTGKELTARAIHERSARREGPFVAVNCAAIPESLIESELFGHEKGAFTGATGARTGLIEAAHGGTLFLDEIGDQPLSAQVRLLRVLQERAVRRVGATREQPVDVRVVAATHQDLAALCRDGRFREDLYYRLRVVEIHLPPLRERGADLRRLAEFLLDKTCRRLGRPALRLSPGALALIERYSWPGNVRELENALERAVIVTRGEEIEAEALGLAEAPRRQPAARSGQGESVPQWSLEEYFRRFLLAYQGTLSETELAERLGISRKALWERRRRLGIPRPE